MADIDTVYRWVNHYKNLLGISHWKIHIRLLEPSDLLEILGEESCFQGRCRVNEMLLEADIELVNVDNMSTAQLQKLGMGDDLRSTLLHEMIHILLEQCNIPDEKLVQYEQAVIRLERAIRILEKTNS